MSEFFGYAQIEHVKPGGPNIGILAVQPVTANVPVSKGAAEAMPSG